MAASSSSPFGIFSMEVWEMICDWMDHTSDIHRTIDAFPQLTRLPMGRKFSWLFCDIAPFVLPKYLSREDILTCRLVCKRWQHAVENVIDSHPDHFSYDSSSLKTITQFNHHGSQEYPITNRLRRRPHGLYAQLQDYQGNPFIGRYLKTFVSNWNMKALHNLDPILRQFGHHIWHADITIMLSSHFTQSKIYEDILEPLAKCFSYLPNLKTLQLHGQCEPGFKFQPEIRPLSNVSLLSNLEVLELSHFENFPKCVYEILVTSFRMNHDQLKKLGIFYNNWDHSLGGKFTNLTELVLSSRLWNSATTGHQLKKLLCDLQAPGLRKLEVRGIFFSDELVHILSPYQIESLDLGMSLIDRSSYVKNHPTLFAVRILKTQLRQMETIGFITTFPELEYLTVEYSRLNWEIEMNNMPFLNISDPISACFCRAGKEEQLDGAYFNCVWDAMSKLKMITILKHQQVTRKFVREIRNRGFSSFNKNILDL